MARMTLDQELTPEIPTMCVPGTVPRCGYPIVSGMIQYQSGTDASWAAAKVRPVPASNYTARSDQRSSSSIGILSRACVVEAFEKEGRVKVWTQSQTVQTADQTCPHSQ
mmetsp:Transcript_1900/g.3436  ORF Transcript_1900/g.3436 Transcript_1900/m.3436 type:complete len:109 (-) Transcript_1900:613-939(-)